MHEHLNSDPRDREVTMAEMGRVPGLSYPHPHPWSLISYIFMESSANQKQSVIRISSWVKADGWQVHSQAEQLIKTLSQDKILKRAWKRLTGRTLTWHIWDLKFNPQPFNKKKKKIQKDNTEPARCGALLSVVPVWLHNPGAGRLSLTITAQLNRE